MSDGHADHPIRDLLAAVVHETVVVLDRCATRLEQLEARRRRANIMERYRQARARIAAERTSA